MHAGKLFLSAALVASAWSSSALAAPVDLELVIGADTSSSIDDREAAQEREGVAAAFRSPEVLRAISSGGLGRIAVLYMEWSGGPNNKIVVNWRTIGDKASADAFADLLLKAPRTYGRGTSIGAAMEMGAALIATSGFEATRRAIDISGDGPNNMGRAVAEVRDEVVARGIVINGLPIMSGEYGGGDWGAYPGELDKYYMHCVIGGQGSFIVPAKGFQEFVAAMRRKLVLEISDGGPASTGIVKVAAQGPDARNPIRPAPAPAKDCGRGGDSFPGAGRVFGGFR
jgi:hypothetical protein